MLHAIISIWTLDSLIKRGLREFITHYVNLASQVDVFHTDDYGYQSWSYWHLLWKCHWMQWEADLVLFSQEWLWIFPSPFNMSITTEILLSQWGCLQILIIFFAIFKIFKDRVSVLECWCCFSHFIDRLYRSWAATLIISGYLSDSRKQRCKIGGIHSAHPIFRHGF